MWHGNESRSTGRGGKRGALAERNWFLFKERDECATTDKDVTVSLPAHGARCSGSAEEATCRIVPGSG